MDNGAMVVGVALFGTVVILTLIKQPRLTMALGVGAFVLAGLAFSPMFWVMWAGLSFLTNSTMMWGLVGLITLGKITGG